IFARDMVLFEALKKRGVALAEIRVRTMTEGGIAGDGYWYEFGALTGKLPDEDYVGVMDLLASELDGKPFYYTQKMYDITEKRFGDISVFEYFLAHFRQDKMKKYQIIHRLILNNTLEALPVIERAGWLSAPKKRDEMIEYAMSEKKTEALAWLLDYKKRTADLAAEQKKAEKKMMRELSMSPDSVAAMRKLWRYKKREDGTLVICDYKGDAEVVTVPEKIGRAVVTEIAKLAFIGCKTIKQVLVPGTVKTIGHRAFFNCKHLEKVTLCEGVTEIGTQAFGACDSLTEIRIPQSVERLLTTDDERGKCNPAQCKDYYSCTNRSHEIFPRNLQMTIYCPKGSKTESFCIERKFAYKCVEAEAT
ncbi:MAG: leucine-rich repeat domain-containing protein, partial [Lachnospiraceae bacterium]|nr:leucine-rich repeat domain-containing protein [Lachnospiraceae bacterium]